MCRNIKALLFTLCITTATGIAFGQESQQKLEAQFDLLLQKESLGRNIKELSAKPHNLGSAGDKEVAEKIYNKFKSFGWDTKIETFYVLFPTPVDRQLELLAPVKYTAILKEPAVAEDTTSGQQGQLPTYNAWGADGEVTAPLVFVNYGIPADYEELERLGIDVKGKIVIAKYGHSWRGIKPKVAYEHGAIGCLIYSDPMDDGYAQGDTYPKGPSKSEYGVQRGSVMDMVIYPGDPLTPGYGAEKNVKRLTKEEAITILKIPVLPISYHDAKPLLEAMDGPVAPAAWRGALPITYRVGGGNKTSVHLKIKQNWDIVPAYDVIAKIKGSTYPDEWVIRGNHHDAWVNGASDPISGMASELEEAKAIGQLIKEGYRPKRTLVYCAWDGEEPGLIGSTEWVEMHAKELSVKAVAYINTDGNSRGLFSAGGSHALTHLITDISKDVKDPVTHATVFDRKRADELLKTTDLKKRKALSDNPEYALEALGSGSDFSSFLQHLGISSLNLAFEGGEGDGEYHSIYDSYDDYIRFKDPDFSYGVALSQVTGRAAMRLADDEKLPFDFRDLQLAIKSYADDLISQAKTIKESYAAQNELIDHHIYQLAADPTKNFIAPKRKPDVPDVDFSILLKAIDSLKTEADALHKRQEAFSGDTKSIQLNNEKLYQAEKALLISEGLPRRPWFKHSIYAPGFYTGYGVKTLPGVREGFEEGNYTEASLELPKLTKTIQQLTKQLKLIY